MEKQTNKQTKIMIHQLIVSFVMVSVYNDDDVAIVAETLQDNCCFFFVSKSKGQIKDNVLY